MVSAFVATAKNELGALGARKPTVAIILTILSAIFYSRMIKI